MSVLEVIPGTRILLRGRITDALTGQGLRGAVTINFRQGGDWRPLPFPLRHQGDGWFAVAARMTEIAAHLRIGAALDLRLTAQSPGHVTAQPTVAITAAEFARAGGAVVIKGQNVPVDRIAGAPFLIDLALQPQPVMLAGLVLSDHDPASPVAGASVTITGGPTILTAANGRFRIDAPPLAQSWALTVTLGPRNAVATHITDFATPVNFITLNLPTIP